MKNLSFLFSIFLLCCFSLQAQAQVLSYKSLPVDSASSFHAYADTVSRPVIYRLNRTDTEAKSLTFTLESVPDPTLFTVTINGNMLSAGQPTFTAPVEEKEFLIELKRKESHAEFIETAHIRITASGKALPLHDLFFSLHSNRPLKRVFVESCVSNYCPYCVTAHAVYDEFSRMYPDLFNGVALHTKLKSSIDPMTELPYWEKLYDKKGVPSMLFDRKEFSRGEDEIRPVNASAPNGLSLAILKKRMQEELFTGLTGSAAHSGTETFEARGAMTFYQPTKTAEYKVGVAVIENNVQGNNVTYTQANKFYSGGANGIMGGYEKLPPVIPYTMIKYQQVARGFLPVFRGVKNLFPDEVKKGDRIEFSLSLPFPESVKKRKNARAILVVFNEKNHAVNSIEVPILNSFPVATEKPVSQEIKVYPKDNGAIVTGAAGKRIRVYSLRGTSVIDRTARTDQEFVPLPKGIAIISIEGTSARKVIIL